MCICTAIVHDIVTGTGYCKPVAELCIEVAAQVRTAKLSLSWEVHMGHCTQYNLKSNVTKIATWYRQCGYKETMQDYNASHHDKRVW